MIEHRIPLAGATGQVGSQAARILLDMGHFVRALVSRFNAKAIGLEGDVN